MNDTELDLIAGLSGPFPMISNRQRDRLVAELRSVRAERDAATRAAEKLAAEAQKYRERSDLLREAVARIDALCDSFDPTSGSGRARAFVGDIRNIIDRALASTGGDKP